MDITSNHLDPAMRDWGVEESEELSKRIEGFGQPVGKGTSHFATPLRHLMCWDRRSQHSSRSNMQNPEGARVEGEMYC